jgi:hypothetical protein
MAAKLATLLIKISAPESVLFRAAISSKRKTKYAIAAIM